MHVAVLANSESWYLKDLLRAAGERHRIKPVTFRQLNAAILGDRTAFAGAEVDFTKLDAVLVRTMPPASLEQVVFRMDVLGRLAESGVPVINPARAIEAAVDKYLASALLSAAGLPTPRTWVAQTAEDALAGFAELGGDVVLKPLFGAEGRGIARINDEAIAQRTFSLIAGHGGVLYLQEYVEHEGFDLRVLIVGKKVWGMRRRNPLDWRTNVSRGATPEPLELPGELIELARRAAAAIGAPVAGVDLLPARSGELFVIEVNAVPGWQALGRVTGVDVAAELLNYVESCRTFLV